MEQQRLLHKLMPYDFSIVHKSGTENRGTDALSRRPFLAALLTLVLPYCVDLVEIQEGQKTDPYTSSIIAGLKEDATSFPSFALVGQTLLYKGRIVVPNVPSIRQKILFESHDTPVVGHGGFLKTYKHIFAQFFWPHLKQDVRTFVQNCLTCQQHKYETLSPAGLLQPLPIPNHIWEDISLDFIVGLPPSNRFDTILVVIDRLSKYAHFLPLTHPFTAKGVAAIFCRDIMKLHGFPRSMVSDRDALFLAI